MREPKWEVTTHVPSGNGKTTRDATEGAETVASVAALVDAEAVIPPLPVVSATRIVAATGAQLSYRSGNAETSTAWATAPSPIACHPGISSRPLGDGPLRPVGAPKNAAA